MFLPVISTCAADINEMADVIFGGPDLSFNFWEAVGPEFVDSDAYFPHHGSEEEVFFIPAAPETEPVWQ